MHAVIEDKQRHNLLREFETAVLDVYADEPWATSEPLLARTFAMLARTYDTGPWEPMRDRLRQRWRSLQ